MALVHEAAADRAGSGVQVLVGTPHGEVDVPVVQRQRQVADREVEIVRRRVPGTAVDLATEAAEAVRRLRGSDIQKPPGIAETIDWVAALELLGVNRLDSSAAERTLGSVLKYRDDQEQIAERGIDWLVGSDA